MAETDRSSALTSVRISVTRDSVCAADDMDAPHERKVTVPRETDPAVFAGRVAAEYGLPRVAGGRATWICELNGQEIAALAQQWTEARAITSHLPLLAINRMHFKYQAQRDPEALG